ncbi:hypothetical protein, conserved [Eimeria tenella]|uniref:Protein kinase domain-containing protein n=1 Tax=Eimeria tenella TaxID=5802 RepID=U6KVQ9_EIMTE|nr:hypothetical protein, conserved [Eimeria tenella]CDJ41008.1 hypothetical protein, conserved [Eimeria tenella]|eukprot:XP_013231758.1 hypothetical protein, conserved [Eimeria tenella]
MFSRGGSGVSEAGIGVKYGPAPAEGSFGSNSQGLEGAVGEDLEGLEGSKLLMFPRRWRRSRPELSSLILGLVGVVLFASFTRRALRAAARSDLGAPARAFASGPPALLPALRRAALQPPPQQRRAGAAPLPLPPPPPQQQQQQQQQQAPPARPAEFSPLRKFESWLSPLLHNERALLAAWRPREPLHDQWSHQRARAVALALSNGQATSLEGLVLTLDPEGPPGGPPGGPQGGPARGPPGGPLGRRGPRGKGGGPRELRVVKVLGSNNRLLVFWGQDVESNEEFAVEVPVISEARLLNFDSEEELVGTALARIEDEAAAAQARGSSSSSAAAADRGLLVPLQRARVRGAPPFANLEGFYVFNKLSLTERPLGTLGELRSQARGTFAAAANYIARRLLHIVLLLERSKVGHANLQWNSFFLRKDGTFVLGDLRSSAAFGEPVSHLMGAISEALEPELALEVAAAKPILLQQTTNLWGLGLLLFDLFTGSSKPYGEGEGRGWLGRASRLARKLLADDAAAAAAAAAAQQQLQQAQVPLRWQQLILRLLHPQRAQRIRAAEIAEEFPDLLSPATD